MPLPLLAVFADVPDPRRETENKLHLLGDVFALATCAVIGGGRILGFDPGIWRNQEGVLPSLPGPDQRDPQCRHLRAGVCQSRSGGVYAGLRSVDECDARAEAIRLLTAALRNGFGHEHVESDKDLDPIRGTPEFKRVVEGVQALRTGVGRQ